ncbi:MAG: cytochrome P450, partial [Cyanobacteria bacterium J06631_12]
MSQSVVESTENHSFESRSLDNLPGPDAREVAAEYARDYLEFMTRCAQEYEEIVPVRAEGELFCLLTNPDHIHAVLKDRLLFVKAEDLQVLRGLVGNGLLTSEGDFWQRQRRLSQPVFHNQRIRGYADVMVRYTERMLTDWHEGDVLDVHQQMMRLTLDIVMKTLFDQDTTDGEASSVARALDAAMNWYVGREDTCLWMRLTGFLRDRQYKKAIEALDETLYTMIEHRRKEQLSGDDLLTMLMQMEDADDGSRMSDRQLRDEAATLILAGHETTANALSWTWMLLANHPHVQQRLTEELKTVLDGRSSFGGASPSPAFSDLPHLVYTDAAIKEAMRLYPPITDISRKATQDCNGWIQPHGFFDGGICVNQMRQVGEGRRWRSPP